MEEYTLFVQANAKGFEAELRDAVESTSDRIANRWFHVEVRTPDDPDVLSVYMAATYPDEMVPSPPGFDWGESPRQEVVHGAIRCRIFSHGADNIRVGVVCADERAREYCTLLVQELDQRLPGALQRTPKAKPKKGPSPTTQARAEVFKRLKDAHPEWGRNAVAQHACKELNVDNITEDTVSNTYKSMGWHWERADRIR